MDLWQRPVLGQPDRLSSWPDALSTLFENCAVQLRPTSLPGLHNYTIWNIHVDLDSRTGNVTSYYMLHKCIDLLARSALLLVRSVGKCLLETNTFFRKASCARLPPNPCGWRLGGLAVW